MFYEFKNVLLANVNDKIYITLYKTIRNRPCNYLYISSKFTLHATLYNR